jgi:hypothetical protein
VNSASPETELIHQELFNTARRAHKSAHNIRRVIITRI